MKRSIRFLIILAVVFVLLISLRRFTDSIVFRRAESVTNTYTFKDSIKDIEIDCSECDVIIKRGSAGSVTVVCREADIIQHDVSVNGDKLVIRRRRDISVTGITTAGIKLEIEVSLPGESYRNADISTSSGDIRTSDDLIFDEVSYKTSSGDIFSSAEVRNSLTCRSSSGDQEISGSSADLLKARSSSGDITLSGLGGKDIATVSRSGRITISDTVISGTLEAKTSSGGVKLDRADAASFMIRSSSGDVRGTILSPKKFRTKSSSGNVSVPSSSGTGDCEISTSSGDIKITIG